MRPTKSSIQPSRPRPTPARLPPQVQQNPGTGTTLGAPGQSHPQPNRDEGSPTLQSRLASASDIDDEDDFVETSDFSAHLLQSLQAKLISLRPPLAKRLADIVEVFHALDEAKHELSAIIKTNSNVVDLLNLQIGLSIFLHYLDEALHSQDPDLRLDPASLRLRQIHTLCKGLAACAPSSGSLLGQSLDLQKDRTCLQGLTDTLLFQAMVLKLPTAAQANGLMLDILDWVRRGLQEGLLQPSYAITACFEISLVLLEEWTGEGACRQLVADHNLGRCAATLGTIARYNAMDLNAVALPRLSDFRELTNRRRLQHCVLSLCAKEVLGPPSASAIDTPSVLQICCTVKDMLDRSLLPARHPAVLKMLDRLLKHIGNLPDHELIGPHRACGPLFSFCNFLRALGHHRVGRRLVFRDALPMQVYACTRLIGCINGDAFAKAGLKSRTLAGLLGFIQFCDQLHAYRSANHMTADTTAGTTVSTTASATVPLGYAELEPATSRLMAGLIAQGADYFNTTRAVGSLLYRLAYLCENVLLPATSANRQFVAALIAGFRETRPEAWGDNAKAVALNALQSLLKMRIVTFEDVLPALVYLLPQAAHGPGGETTKVLAEDFQRLGVVEAALMGAMEAAVDATAGELLEYGVAHGLEKALNDAMDEAVDEAAAEVVDDVANALQSAPSTRAWSFPGLFATIPPSQAGLTIPVITVIKREPELTGPTPRLATSLAAAGTGTTTSSRISGTGIAVGTARQASPSAASTVEHDHPSMKRLVGHGSNRKAKAGKKKPSMKNEDVRTTPISRAGLAPASPLCQAIVQGEPFEVRLLMNQQAAWPDIAIATALDEVMRGRTTVDKHVLAALKEFFDGILRTRAEAGRETLKQYFAAHPPEFSGLDALLVKTGLALAMPDLKTDQHALSTTEKMVEFLAFATDKAFTQFLSEKTASSLLNAKNQACENVLHLAASSNLARVVERVLKRAKGAQLLSQKDVDGLTPLAIAAHSGHDRVASALLDHPTASEQASTPLANGEIALTLAAQNGHATVVGLLLGLNSAATQVTALNKNGANALMQAAQFGHEAVVDLLLKGPMATEQVTKILETGSNSLMLAVQSNHVEVVEKLLSHSSAATLACAANKQGWNALMIAAQKGYKEIARRLLARAPFEEQALAVNNDKANALMLAAWAGDSEIVALLLAHPSATRQAVMVNRVRRNALMAAAGKGRMEAVKLLLATDSATAQAAAVSAEGWNAFMLAQRNGHHEIAALLGPFSTGAH
jgi:ankyrin repeat protein